MEETELVYCRENAAISFKRESVTKFPLEVIICKFIQLFCLFPSTLLAMALSDLSVVTFTRSSESLTRWHFANLLSPHLTQKSQMNVKTTKS